MQTCLATLNCISDLTILSLVLKTRVLELRLLRPADTGRGRHGDKHLARSGSSDLLNLLHPSPLCGDDEKCPLVVPAEHTRKAPAVNADGLQNLTALRN